MNWLKHAFAISSQEQIEPNRMQRALVEKLCSEVVRRRLTTPALFMLESSRPLNYVSVQFLHFLKPVATIIADTNEYESLTQFLEHRGSIDYICCRLDALEAEFGAKGGPAAKPTTQEADLQSQEPHAKG